MHLRPYNKQAKHSRVTLLSATNVQDWYKPLLHSDLMIIVFYHDFSKENKSKIDEICAVFNLVQNDHPISHVHWINSMSVQRRPPQQIGPLFRQNFMTYLMVTKYFVYSLSTMAHFATVLCWPSHKYYNIVCEFVYFYQDERSAHSKSRLCSHTIAVHMMHCNRLVEQTCWGNVISRKWHVMCYYYVVHD